METSGGSEEATSDSPTRTLLVVSPHFPPMLTSQSIRVHKLLANLPPSWQIHVVTTDINPHYPRDDKLLEDVPSNITIHRVEFALRHDRWIPRFFRAPYRFIGWAMPALARSLALLSKEPVDAVLSMFPPVGANVVGVCLKVLTRTPWLADLADPWMRNPYHEIDERQLAGKIVGRLERLTVDKCDAISFPSPELVEFYRERYADIPTKGWVLPNPYDLGDFNGHDNGGRSPADPYVILHSGSIYGLRDPRPVLAALRRVMRGKDAPEIRLLLQGRFAVDDESVISSVEGMGEVVEMSGPMNHVDAVSSMQEADVLLLLDPSPRVPNFFQPLKLAEYLAAGKPILALAPEGHSKRVIDGLQAGAVAPSDDGEAVESALRECLRLADLCRGGQFGYEAPRELDVRTVARRLSNRILELT